MYIYTSSSVSAPRILNNTFSNNDAASTTVTGQGQGGGIFVNAKDGAISILGNRFEGNTAAGSGGGVHLGSSANGLVVVRRNTFTSNNSVRGAGLYLEEGAGSDVKIENNLFLQNTNASPSARGGGVRARVVGAADLRIVNNTFSGNSVPAGRGAGLWLDNASATLPTVVANNIFANNTALNGGGIDHQLYIGTIRNCDFWNNAGGNLYDAGAGGTTLVSNLFVDPLFSGAASGNYRLKAASPCIDAADQPSAPPEDKDQALRPFDGNGDTVLVSDIGAYEYPSGEIFGISFLDNDTFDWGLWPVAGNYNVYRGSVARLKSLGEYTQNPASEPLAAKFCNLTGASVPFLDTFVPPVSQFAFYLVSLKNGAWEGILGTNSLGALRANQNPCP